MEIREIKKEEWNQAIGVAWRTFLKFEANEYSAEGVKNFYQFIIDDTLFKMFQMGHYQMWGAFEKNKIVGILGVRNSNHISLLFVEEEYHKRGIASGLLKNYFQYLLTEVGMDFTTVNSSPYAVGFYHKLGFVDTDVELTKDGIRYTPMTCTLKSGN
ncbi:MAG: GNAT family N-acetyltransferase [Lachnospiraceae bacterium]|nr:GNAT family N-acetyltransferase [Lachnospiraceae bacterium]